MCFCIGSGILIFSEFALYHKHISIVLYMFRKHGFNQKKYMQQSPQILGIQPGSMSTYANTHGSTTHLKLWTRGSQTFGLRTLLHSYVFRKLKESLLTLIISVNITMLGIETENSKYLLIQ